MSSNHSLALKARNADQGTSVKRGNRVYSWTGEGFSHFAKKKKKARTHGTDARRSLTSLTSHAECIRRLTPDVATVTHFLNPQELDHTPWELAAYHFLK